MLLLPLNLYTLLPLGTDDEECLKIYLCLTFTCGHFTVRMENGIFNQLGSRWSCGCLGIIVELKFQFIAFFITFLLASHLVLSPLALTPMNYTSL